MFRRLLISMLLVVVAGTVGAPYGWWLSNAEAAVLPTSGLVSLWSAENNALDSNGSNHGSLKNGATYSAGKSGQAFSLNGTNSYVEVPDSPSLTLSGNFSINVWVKYNSVRSGTGGSLPNVFIGHDQGGGSVPKWIFFSAADGLYLHLNGSSSAWIGPVAFVPNTGTWYNLSVTREGTLYSFYVNGTLAGTVTDAKSFPDVSGPLTIGKAEDLGYFNGLIDEVALYNRALTAVEVQNIYTQTSTPNPPTSTGTTSQPVTASCAILSSKGLTIPCLGVAGNFYSATLSFTNSTAMRFHVDSLAPTAQASVCANFNAGTSLTHIPCVDYQGASYQADLKLINTNPLTLELSGFGAQAGNTKTVMVTERDAALSATDQKAVAAKIRNLNAAVKQSIVAINELLYTDFKSTSFADFQKRRETADKALAMEIAASSALKTQAKSAQQIGQFSQDAEVKTLRASGGVAGDTLSLGISARADAISSQLNAIDNKVGPEARRLQSALNQEVAYVSAQEYANQATISDILLKATAAIDAGNNVAALVVGGAIALPAMASASIPTFLIAHSAFVVGGLRTMVGMLDDLVIFSGGNGPLPSDKLPMLGKVNRFFGLITLRGDTVVETGLNVVNFISGDLVDLVNGNVQFDPSSDSATVTPGCFDLKQGGVGKAVSSCPSPPAVTPSIQLRAGTYRDPRTGAQVVSTGLDSEWEATIRSLSNQVLLTQTAAPSITSSPTVTGISPMSGPYGTTITITGTGFGSTKGTVYLNPDNHFPSTLTVTSWSDTKITAIITSSRTGWIDVHLADGQGIGVPSGGYGLITFTVTATPTPTPTSGTCTLTVKKQCDDCVSGQKLGRIYSDYGTASQKIICDENCDSTSISFSGSIKLDSSDGDSAMFMGASATYSCANSQAFSYTAKYIYWSW